MEVNMKVFKKLIRAFTINYYSINKLINALTNQLLQIIAIILLNMRHDVALISGAHVTKNKKLIKALQHRDILLTKRQTHLHYFTVTNKLKILYIKKVF